MELGKRLGASLTSVGQRGTQLLDPLQNSYFESSFVGITGTSEVTFEKGTEMARGGRRFVSNKERGLVEEGKLKADENLEGIVTEVGADRPLQDVVLDLEDGKAEIELTR
ncbi:unnamed protein product [Calypogeia fissa]